MRIPTEAQLIHIWGREHSTNGGPDVVRDIMSRCEGVKNLTLVHRYDTTLDHLTDNAPQFGELLTWVFKGYRGERVVRTTWCQWVP